MFLLFLLPTALSLGYDQIGQIKPSGSLSISNSITNVRHYADYTFTFMLTNDLPSSGVLSIEFPTQFENNLGIAGNPSCSTSSCVLSGNTVHLTVSKPIPANQESSITIKSIKNPGKSGGTGNFKLKTSYSSYIIDMNLVFGSIGISDSPSELALVTVQVLPGSSEVAGDISKYLFTFQSSVDIPAGSWLLFTFPDSGIYIPDNPSCSSFASSGLNVEGDLQCLTKDLEVQLSGISQDLFSGFQYNIRMTGTNPRWSAKLGYFSLRIFRENTNTLLTYKENIKGFTVKTSDFLELSLKSVEKNIELSKNSVILYKLHVRVKNPVEEKGFIIVDFPPTFTVEGDYLVWVESGLNDFNYTDKVEVDYSIPNLRLTITNFQAIPAEQVIEIILQLKNPSTSGPSESLTVYSLRPDRSTVIDFNSTGAFVEISENSSPSLSVTYPTANQAGGGSIDLNFQLVPNIKVPAEGFVVFKFPSNFTTSSLACKVTPYGTGTDSAKSCLVKDDEIWVQLFVATSGSVTPSGPGDFVAGQQSSVKLTLLSPLYSDYYFFSVSTFDTSKNLLETGGVMVFIDATNFESLSVQAANTALNMETVLMIKAKSSSEIPSGLESFDTLALRGYLEIQLPTQDDSGNYLFDLDLGIGLEQDQRVSCKGVKIITGLDTSELTCIVTSRPTVPSIGTPVIITVSDFYTIPANVDFEVHLAGFKYFLSAYPGTVKVQAYSMQNRLKRLIHSGTSNLPAGSSLPASRSYTSSSTFLTSEVQELNELSLTFNFSGTVGSSSSYLLFQINPTHDSGYCNSIEVQCQLDDYYECYCYPGADLLLVYLPNGLTANTYQFKVSGLVNPESVSSTNDQIWLFIIDDSAVVDYVKLGDLPSLDPGSMSHTAFFIDQSCASCVNVGYEFFMRVLNQIPEEGSIVITLDSSKSYSLHYSSPVPFCSYFSVNGIKVESYKCTPYRNILTLSSLPFIESGSLIRVLLKGVKNPSVVGSLGNLQYESKNQFGRVIDFASFTAGSLDSELEVEDVETALISNFPKNEGSLAEYSIFFTPISSIGPGASIEIDFPTKNFEQFINPPNCRVSIGISFIKDCLFYGKTLRVLVNSEYHNSQITVHVLDILNFPAGISESFEIRVIYDGTVLQKSTSSITVSTTTAAKAISTTLIHFYPKNEAETATYEFHISPSEGFSSSSALTIGFPVTFDKRLGDFIECWAIGLKGYIKCEVVRSWTVQVYDHDDYLACESCSITLFVWGVINPNYEKSSNTGQFKVGVEKSENFQMLNDKAGELGMQSSGGILSLWTTTASNQFSRTLSDFSFNFSTSYSIPSSSNLGAIWVEFPSDFILEGSSISCSSSSNWSSGSPSCRIEFNTIQVLSSSEKTAGDFQLTLKNLCNPLFNVTAGYINLKIFDGNNNQIISRSYPNLSKNQLKFDYPGPLIHVNNDEPFTVERGTVSKYVKVTFDYPCALNLTLQPYTFGFVFIPTSVQVSVGEMEKSFRVSASPSVDDTLYVISWKITGEVNPTYYTPITKSLFQVVKTGKVEIVFEPIPDIPKAGSSIPIQVTLKYSPYNNIHLLFSVSTMYSGITILPQKMEFRAGTIQGFYKIFISNSTQASSSFVTISLTGDDSSVFELSEKEIRFGVLNEDLVLPDVTSIAVTQIKRASAGIVLTTSKVSTVFYAFALFGTLQPSFDELTQGGPPSYDTSDIQYGTLYISSSCVKNLTLSGLAAGTRYTIFAIAVDQRGVYSEIARTANFSTLPVYSPAVVGLWFSQTYLTSVEKEIIKGTVALVLGLNFWQVIESQVKSSRFLSSSSDQIVTFFQMYLIDNPRSDDYPKPKDMIKLLQMQKNYLSASLSNFNKSASIEGQEVVLSPCSWYQSPYLLGTSDYRSISLAGSLVEAGYLFGIAVPALNDTGTPLGYQISSGLDAANRKTRADHRRVELKSLGNLTFTNLTADVHYNVYVVCGNLVPGFAEVSQDVKFIRWKTDMSPAAELLDVDFGKILFFSGFLIVLM